MLQVVDKDLHLVAVIDDFGAGVVDGHTDRAAQGQGLLVDEGVGEIDGTDGQIDVLIEPEDRIPLFHRMGRIFSERLEQDRQAIDTYLRVLEIEPSNIPALTALAHLYRQTQAWDELAQTLYQLVEYGTTVADMPDERLLELFSQLGELLGEVLMRPQDSIDAWNRVLDIDPASFRALGELEKVAGWKWQSVWR